MWLLDWVVGVCHASYQIPDHISIDMASVGGLGLIMLTALATVWVLRKLIKTVNRS
jgi:flagellar biogenesis protein FliO